MSFSRAVLVGASIPLVAGALHQIVNAIQLQAPKILPKIPDHLIVLATASVVMLCTKTPFLTSLTFVVIGLISVSKQITYSFWLPAGWKQIDSKLLASGVLCRYEGTKIGSRAPFISLIEENCDDSLENFVQALENQYKKMKNFHAIPLGNFQPSCDKGMLLEVLNPTDSGYLRLHQFVIAKHSKYFVLTVGAPYEEFDQHFEIFNKVLESLRLGDDKTPCSPMQIEELAKLRKKESANITKKIELLSQLKKKETQYCYFIPPQGWTSAGSNSYSPSLTTSVSLEMHSYAKSLNDYVQETKRRHEENQNTVWRDLGSLRTPLGKGQLTEIQTEMGNGPRHLMRQLVIITNRTAYVLTATALMGTFSQHSKTFGALLSSLSVKKTAIPFLTLPEGWYESDPTNLYPNAEISFCGKKTGEIPPSISLEIQPSQKDRSWNKSDTETDLEQSGKVFHVWQRVVLKNQTAYLFRASALKEEFSEHRSIFETMLESVKVATILHPAVTLPKGWILGPEISSPQGITQICTNLSPSVNLVTEEGVEMSLEEYVKSAKQGLEENPKNRCRIKGYFTTPLGTGQLLETEMGSLLIQQFILIKNRTAYVLTAGAPKEEFEHYAQIFQTVMESLRVEDDLADTVELKNLINDLEEIFENDRQGYTSNVAFFESAFFQQTCWEPFKKKITNDFTKMGPYWQALVLQDTKEKLLIKGLAI